MHRVHSRSATERIIRWLTGVACMTLVQAAWAAEPPCEPRPDPLQFTLSVDPPQPQVGDEVRLTVGAREVDGLLVGHASVSVLGAEPVFDGRPLFHRQDGVFSGSVTFTTIAQVGGIAELTISMNYETECACPPRCYYRRTVVSAPFQVAVSGPTATPTSVCTPPICAGDEVFSCADPCPGGCGMICATRTPTACPTPACASTDVLACPNGDCPGGCGLICAVRTPTPIPPIPTPACSGDCDSSGAVTIDELLVAVNYVLGALPDAACGAADANGDGQVLIADLVAAVARALSGC